MCVCTCVCERKIERRKKKEGEKQKPHTCPQVHSARMLKNGDRLSRLAISSSSFPPPPSLTPPPLPPSPPPIYKQHRNTYITHSQQLVSSETLHATCVHHTFSMLWYQKCIMANIVCYTTFCICGFRCWLRYPSWGRRHGHDPRDSV